MYLLHTVPRLFVNPFAVQYNEITVSLSVDEACATGFYLSFRWLAPSLANLL